MNHENIDTEPAAGLKELQRRIAAHDLPPSTLDQTLKIATWNIREYAWDAFYPEAKKPFDQKFTYQLSDHLPLWIMVDTDTAEEKIDQILSPRRAAMKRHSR